MPSSPKISYVDRLIRRIEIWFEWEAHESRQSNRHIGVAREVGINMQWVRPHGKDTHKAWICLGCVSNFINEVNEHEVGNDNFLHQSLHNLNDGPAKVVFGELKWLTNLWNEIARSNDRSHHQLWEEGYEEGIMKEVFYWLNFFAVDVHYITDILKRKKGNADGEKYFFNECTFS